MGLNYRTVRALAFTAIVALVIALLARLTYGTRFDQKVWVANPGGCGGQDTARSKMIDDVQFRILKIGMSRRQVRGLLGPPDPGSQMDQWENRDVYCYGHVGAFGIDPSILSLQFDETDRLQRIEAGET